MYLSICTTYCLNINFVVVYYKIMSTVINSTSNPKIKWVRSLHKNSVRKKENVFLVEGVKEIVYALEGGYQLNCIFVCPDIYTEELSNYSNTDIFSVSKECYEKIAYRDGTNGLLAVFHAKHRSLDELTFGENPFFIVVEDVEKPGNLGAIIRTADGAGADGVIICSEKTDIFNPNVIRSSVGTIFTKQVVTATNSDVYDFYKNTKLPHTVLHCQAK